MIMNQALVILLFLLTACTTTIDTTNYVDQNAPFELQINAMNTRHELIDSVSDLLSVESDKYRRLINWLDNNHSE